jgi:LmbE family N-acetylglucosaminyl deacetylase
MAARPLSVSAVGAAVVCAVAFLLAVVSTAKATESCTSPALYVVAHEDDSLLFQSPSVLQDIQSGRCVRTVFLTAGDAGRVQSYWSGREDGVEAAYAQMAGVSNQWTGSQVTANGHSIHLETLTARPGISLLYMRLPDGGTNGDGYERYGFQSLAKLWRKGNGGSPTISSISAVDGSTSYSYQNLLDTLVDLIESFEPQQIYTQNYTVGLVGPDHSDHVGVGDFVQRAQEEYEDPHRLVGFKDYEISSEPQNVFGELLGAKSFAFYTYGLHDSDACADESHCSGTSYAKWLLRQYVAESETEGVVAHAGYYQLTTTSANVTLDGSQSSDESGHSLNYEWTQTGGPTVSLSGATTVSPSFVTPSHGTLLTFSLTVRDGSTVSAPDVVKVRVPSSDPTPTAVAGSNQTVASGATVNLDGSGSWDPNSLPLGYAWIQTSGPLVSLSGSSSKTPSFTAPTGPATLKFSLVVSNGTQTSAPSTITVNVNGVAPVFTSANASTFTTGVKKEFTVSTSGSPLPALAKTGTLPTGISFTDNGDGTATLGGTAAAVAAPPGSQTNYPLTFNATSAAGNASQSFTLTVVNPGVAVEPPPQEVPSDPAPSLLESASSIFSPPQPSAPEARPAIRLSKSTVRLPIGKSSRRVVKVLPTTESPVTCTGTLPPGARCRITPQRDIVVEGSSAVRRAGTYRLSIDIANRDVQRPLIVQVSRLKRPALDSARAKGPQRP